MAAEALCEESRSVEAVLCPGQCFAGKPWTLRFTWKLLWHINLPKDCCRHILPFMAVVLHDGIGLFQQDHPDTLKKLFRNSLRNMAKVQRFWLSVYVMDLIFGGPTSQLAGLKLSAANVPMTLWHYRTRSEVLWSQYLNTSELFGSTRKTFMILGRFFNDVAGQCKLSWVTVLCLRSETSHLYYLVF